MLVNELIVEARKKELDYTTSEVKGKVDKVVVKLEGAKSGSFTALAKNFKELKTEIDALNASLNKRKDELKDKMGDYFDAEDAVLTRVMETCSLTMQMSKATPAGMTTDYEVAFNSLVTQLADLVPDLKDKVKMLVTASMKAAEKKSNGRASSFTVTIKGEVKEGVLDYFKGLIAKLIAWGSKYDKKLSDIRREAYSKKIIRQIATDPTTGAVWNQMKKQKPRV